MAEAEDPRVTNSPRVVLLSGEDVLDGLTRTEKLYAHHMAKAAWYDTRIVLRQVSPESDIIFDFILELYRFCGGEWECLRQSIELSESDMHSFLEFAAVFLHNIGNYYGKGDQKFTPNLTDAALEKLSKASSSTSQLFSRISKSLTSTQPARLGFTDETSQTSYYIGLPLTAVEIERISDFALKHSVQLENTRIYKGDGGPYDVLVASAEKGMIHDAASLPKQYKFRIVRGDHSTELEKICGCLARAKEYASNSTQRESISKLQATFQTGDMELYRDSQRLWVQDCQPSIETIFGFVEPYRDPAGVRAEFEALSGIVHKQETELLRRLVRNGDRFIATLPWVTAAGGNRCKGPFEVSKMGFKDFTSIQPLAWCSTIIWAGQNLPNYNDICQSTGSKNILCPASLKGRTRKVYAHLMPESEREFYLAHCETTYYLYIVFHELFGHGTGRFLEETAGGMVNFDMANPPVNPVTGKPVASWYHLGQTYTQLFGDIAASVEECRAECIGSYLLSNRDLLSMCGFTEETDLTASDLEHALYMDIAVDGLRDLIDYSLDGHKWTQAHSRAHFAMLRTLLETCGDFMSIKADLATQDITIHVDRSKIATHGRPAIGLLALKLHMFRCTASVEGCRNFYENLTTVEEPYLSWRQIIMAKKPPDTIFVQPNSFLDGDTVRVKGYPATVEGMIQSWAEREV